MNAEAPVSSVTAPPAPRTLSEIGLSIVMMRDILLKSMFRSNLDQVTTISKLISLPMTLTQELVDLARATPAFQGSLKLDPDFPWDGKNRGRIQLLTVCAAQIEKNPLHHAPMREAVAALDITRLAAFLN